MSRTIQSRTNTYTRTQYERPRRETIVEKIDGMEGNDISDDDLDIINVVTKEVDAGNTDKYIQGQHNTLLRDDLSSHVIQT
jgi:hypothetical protein